MRPKNVKPKEMKAQRNKRKRLLFPKDMNITKEEKRITEKANKRGARFGKKWYPYND